MNSTASRNDLHPDALLSDQSLTRILEVGRSTLWCWVNRGTFPPPVRIGGCTRWRWRDVQCWLERQAQGTPRVVKVAVEASRAARARVGV